jgi:hypothetical protein
VVIFLLQTSHQLRLVNMLIANLIKYLLANILQLAVAL